MLDAYAAARAVLDAYQFAPLDDAPTAAAVIRAAAAQAEFPPRSDADPLWNEGFAYAQSAFLGDLLAIADELDRLPTDDDPFTASLTPQQREWRRRKIEASADDADHVVFLDEDIA